MSKVTGKKVNYEKIPAKAIKATVMQYGATNAATQGLVDILSFDEKRRFNRVKRTSHTSSPTSFENGCEHVFKPTINS